MTDFDFDKAGRFTLRNYDQKPAFSSFLPGIAGVMGIPMWVFYVNRGQGIAAFGIESKDVPIVEFQPANKAYQTVTTTGFRTFIKLKGKPPVFYEPFGGYPSGQATNERQMAIGMNELHLSEEAAHLNLRVEVTTFNLTNEPLAGLVRQVTITNTGQDDQSLEVLDGLPVVVPFGMNDDLLKNMARTAEAWMGVAKITDDVPFYRLRSSISDTVEIEQYEAGHFFAAFTDDDRRLPVMVDPNTVFGENTAFSAPDRFLQADLATLYGQSEIRMGRTPCGFIGTARTLRGGESLVLNSIIGHTASAAIANLHLDRMMQTSYINEQHKAARQLVDDLTQTVAISTSNPRLDAYTRQTFLDNMLRGGWPIILKGGDKQFVQHVYSRKHGDLERDYNAFYLASEYYSQGNGNYRDVNQNRREDVWLNPAVGDYNIITFMNLLQTDGYNPLVVRGNQYTIPEAARDDILALVDAPQKLATVLAELFTPGSLLKAVTIGEMGLRVSPQVFLAEVLSRADQLFAAEFGEGCWTDHWTYNLDLIENYLAIYPDRKQHLLFEKPVFTFYDSAVFVKPRREKHVLVDGVVRQREAVRHDSEKADLIKARHDHPHVMRDQHGTGDVFSTTLIVKLVCLAAIKFATLDPTGVGIEMEANKPGWYDALNGLPGLLGSSVPESFELVRLLRFINQALSSAPGMQLALPEEIGALIHALEDAVKPFEETHSEDRSFVFWDAAATAREHYRDATRLGYSGKMTTFAIADLNNLLVRFATKLQHGLEQAIAQNDGIPPTYLRFEVVSYDPLASSEKDAPQPVQVTAVKAIKLPLFLEGPVRSLSVETDTHLALRLHEQVKASALYDKKLGMFKVNASLEAEPFDIGRARAFLPGWLENESIWLHMAYKYLFGLLRSGLYDAFYDVIQQGLVPFQPPERYGRSPLENASFIVSSAHPDTSLHGRGYVARLSGSTAEYLSILNHIMFGPQPFAQTPQGLTLHLSPILAGWLFDEQGTVKCTFLGSVHVTYVNTGQRNTFGPNGVKPVKIALKQQDRVITTVDGATIPEPYASQIRRGEIEQITVHLA